MDQEKLIALLVAEEITLTNVIDAVLEINGLIGVGLISLADDVGKYIIESRKGYRQ
jgi:hypothetical protein